MTVRVRLFASLREAAGTEEVQVPAGPLADVLDGLRQRFGEPFGARLAVSSVLVDGTAAPADAVLDDGAEVVCLPPVSGGAGTTRLPLLLHCTPR